ncbi:MAG TPA: flagellar assembly protein FliW [Ruminococcaceae bacterium]|nr:flagellar assembly protein FliW [Oscillospiraceae bacterium]
MKGTVILMKINTRDFGEIDVNEDDILTFPFGLYGFEELRKFALLTDPEKQLEGVYWLQSLEEPNLCFIVFNPCDLISDYKPKLSAYELDSIELCDFDKMQYFCIAVIRNDFYKSTINLFAPIVVNLQTNVAKQIISESDTYSMRHPLSAFLPKEG